MFFTMLLTQGGTADSCSNGNSLPMILILVGVLLVAMFIMPMFQRRKDKEKSNLRDTISKGDVVLTIGGIVGTVVSVSDTPNGKQFTIETGAEDRKSTMTLDIQALYSFVSRGEVYLQRKAQEDAERAEAERLAAEAKAAKKAGRKPAEKPADDAFEKFDSVDAFGDADSGDSDGTDK